MSKVTESIYDGEGVIIPMADVQHIEKHWYSGDDRKIVPQRGISIITKHTKWNMEVDVWENPIYMMFPEAKEFLKCWQVYRMQLEDGTLKDLRPDK